MKPVLLFDLNETLIDFSKLDTWFDRWLGAGARRVWFAELLRMSLVCNSIGTYRDFSVLAVEALKAVAPQYRDSLSADVGQALGGAIRSLPAYLEVPAALQRIAASERYRIAILTNSPPGSANEQIENAGLAGYFEQTISVDSAESFKPRPEPYVMAAKRLGTSLDNIIMIAAHDWDIAGAMKAGAGGILIRRHGLPFNPALVTPTATVDDLSGVADYLLSSY